MQKLLRQFFLEDDEAEDPVLPAAIQSPVIPRKTQSNVAARIVSLMDDNDQFAEAVTELEDIATQPQTTATSSVCCAPLTKQRKKVEKDIFEHLYGSAVDVAVSKKYLVEKNGIEDPFLDDVKCTTLLPFDESDMYPVPTSSYSGSTSRTSDDCRSSRAASSGSKKGKSVSSKTPTHNGSDLVETFSGDLHPNIIELSAPRANEELLLQQSTQSSNIMPDSFLSATVPAAAARYLMPHQVSGVRWLWDKYVDKKGAILGDDMGLGKTFQVIALLLAVLGKTGVTAIDQRRIRTKRKHHSTGSDDTTADDPITVKYCAQLPSLIVCPSSVVDNWVKEINTWGHFSVVTLSGVSKETIMTLEDLVSAAKQCQVDIVVLTYNKMLTYADSLSVLHWELVVWDEGHRLRNEKSRHYQAAMKFHYANLRLILSGTPIQNKIIEIWSLLSIVTNGRFFDQSSFRERFENPMKRGQSTKASKEAITLSRKRQTELQKLLSGYLLARSKESELSEQLTEKNECIVFCELTPFQAELYQYVLSLPDFSNIRWHALACPCESGAKRGKCCQKYRLPLTASKTSSSSTTSQTRIWSDIIDERAVLWRLLHPNDEPCDKCPTCALLPCLQKLSQIASHPALLQNHKGERRNISSTSTGQPFEVITGSHSRQFVTEALSSKLLQQLGGANRSSDFINNGRFESSGKLIALHKLLTKFSYNSEKTLIFSYSTAMLDILTEYVKCQGWQYCRLDGSTLSHQRTKLCASFNSDPGIFVFLISTKAGGEGLNLKSANRVIIYDVNWNPAADMQAQDRVYRIGQLQDVTVFRLVSQGTVEELIYMRQLYKRSLSSLVLGAASDTDEAARFEGVEGDSDCRGELFGIENLFQYDQGSIIKRLRAKYCGAVASGPSDSTSTAGSSSGAASFSPTSKKSQLQKRVTEVQESDDETIDTGVSSDDELSISYQKLAQNSVKKKKQDYGELDVLENDIAMKLMRDSSAQMTALLSQAADASPGNAAPHRSSSSDRLAKGTAKIQTDAPSKSTSSKYRREKLTSTVEKVKSQSVLRPEEGIVPGGEHPVERHHDKLFEKCKQTWGGDVAAVKLASAGAAASSKASSGIPKVTTSSAAPVHGKKRLLPFAGPKSVKQQAAATPNLQQLYMPKYSS